MNTPASWIVPEWPAPAHVRAICTTRDGGVSQGPYASLNLGDHVGDAPQTVATNRKIFCDAIQARPVFLTQVHGSGVVPLTAQTRDGVQADACVATARGLACTIMVADCLPLLFTTGDGNTVAAAHAGWRGLAGQGGQGILESVWERLRRDHGARADETMAWLGPCIGPQAFEVGPEVKAAFEAYDASAGAMFKPHTEGKWLADLAGLARMRLQALGLRKLHGNDGGAKWCTVANRATFFSHRRDRVSGRFAASIWRT
jgi:YfiH family protein